MTGHDGGAAFIFLYIICVLLLGVPGMVAEFVVGRHTSANAAKAYRKISGGGGWSVIGYMGVFTSMVILGFYAVVAGWCLEYFFASVAGNVVGYPGGAEEAFRAFSTNSYLPMVFTVAFILLTHAVVTRGVRKGIERASNLLMPLLFILLLVLLVASCMLPGASAGILFSLSPTSHNSAAVSCSMLLVRPSSRSLWVRLVYVRMLLISAGRPIWRVQPRR